MAQDRTYESAAPCRAVEQGTWTLAFFNPFDQVSNSRILQAADRSGVRSTCRSGPWS
jgi:hypothetical protein